MKAKLAEASRLSIILVSNSMAPVLPSGATAEIQPVTYEKIQPLDFVVFFDAGQLICHAVWDKGVFKSANGERTIITRGLSNPAFDHPVRESMILGRVESHRISKPRFLYLSLKAKFISKFKFSREPRKGH